jgi:hypothetical protein
VRQTVELKDRLAKSSLAICLILIATTAALSGCGGSGSGSSSSPAPRSEAIAAVPDPPTARRAEAICRRAGAEVGVVAGNLPAAMKRNSSAEQGITEGLVRPAIGILEREGADLEGLHPKPESATFSTFVGLFEPVISLAHQRLASGEAADIGTSQQLEKLTESLTTEQAKLAASLGLTACETDFFEALGTAQ